ncbi:MAG: hypothetical protein EZS28_031948, partial [Streblomastix strix]
SVGTIPRPTGRVSQNARARAYVQQLLTALENALLCVKMFNFVASSPYLASSVDAACLKEYAIALRMLISRKREFNQRLIRLLSAGCPSGCQKKFPKCSRFIPQCQYMRLNQVNNIELGQSFEMPMFRLF